LQLLASVAAESPILLILVEASSREHIRGLGGKTDAAIGHANPS
jgi:hypothetical protein